MKNHVQLLKETFDPTSVEGYGEFAGEIAAELDKVKETFVSGTSGDKDSGYHYLYHLTDDKNEILEQGLDVAELMNHLLAITLIGANKSESRVFDVVKPLLVGESAEHILADVFEDVETNYEPLSEALIKVSVMLDKLIENDELIDRWDKRFEINELRFAFELTKEGISSTARIPRMIQYRRNRNWP